MSDKAPAGIRERICQGHVLTGTFLNLGSAIAAEICGNAGFDWVVVDLEHGSGTEAELIGQLQALSGTVAVGLVRVESHERSRIGRVLDAGAAGVMVPRVETGEEAQAVASAMRYPPLGTRGVALMNRAASFGGHTAALSAREKDLLLAVQIETPMAVVNVADIAAVDGVDVLFVGPSDLSHSLGIFKQFDDERFVEAVRTVESAATGCGKVAGVLAADLADAQWFMEVGFTFVGISGDGGFLASGARAAASGLRAHADGGSPVTTDGVFERYGPGRIHAAPSGGREQR